MMRNRWTSFKSLASLGLGASLGLATMGLGSCGSTTPPEEMMMMEMPPPDVVQVNPAMAFDHDGLLGASTDPFADGLQVPVEKSQRMHACGKLSYATMGRILTRRGVTMTAGAQCPDATNGPFDCTAGSLFVSGNLVLGIANYPARVSESDRNSTGGIVRMQDIMIGASEQLITTGNANGAFPATGTDCTGLSLFNAGTPATCNADGFACFVGLPLTQSQLTLCNQMVADPTNTDPIVAKRLTLSALATSIYLCD
jgi:hypothetical protein